MPAADYPRSSKNGKVKLLAVSEADTREIVRITLDNEKAKHEDERSNATVWNCLNILSNWNNGIELTPKQQFVITDYVLGYYGIDESAIVKESLEDHKARIYNWVIRDCLDQGCTEEEAIEMAEERVAEIK